MSHREEMFGKLPPGTYLWCLHCNRTYQTGEYREMNIKGYTGMQSCPYEDCGGDAVIDAIEWEEIREDNPKYPKSPKRGVVYP
jgi:hypothetical protein